jgi:hypothetical protein
MYFTLLRFGWINLVLLLLSTKSGAQIVQYDRYEMVLEERYGLESPKVTVLGEEGILIHRRVTSRISDQLEITKLDTTLKQQWRGVVNVEKDMRLTLTRAHQQRIYFLLRSTAYGNFNFLVIVMNVRNGNFSILQIKNLIPFNPSHFLVTEHALVIGGYFNYRPVVIHFSFTSGRSRLLPGFFNEQAEMNQLSVYPDGSIDVIINSRNFQRKKVIWLRNYSAEGDLLRTRVIEPDPDKNFVFAKSIHRADDSQILAGAYGGLHPEFSRGFFMALVKPSGEYSIHYYPFGDLDNFFKYLNPKREARIKARIEHRKLKNRKNRQSFRILTHEIIPYNNQYILLCEAFYPRYIYPNPYGYYGMGLGTAVRGERIFDGYRYTHAILVGINEDGRQAWNNIFEINDVKNFALEQFVKVFPLDNKLHLVYLFENTLHTKVIRESEVLESKKSTGLKTRFPNDWIKDKATESSKLEYWYNHTFAAYGIQNIRNTRYGRENQERKVLFINKLKFDR